MRLSRLLGSRKRHALDLRDLNQRPTTEWTPTPMTYRPSATPRPPAVTVDPTPAAQVTGAAPAEAAWPNGVIARYLTVGGATVDVQHDNFYLSDTEPNLSVARCGGCAATQNEQWRNHSYRSDNGSRGADAEASTWAQSHAEQCRAIPKPAA